MYPVLVDRVMDVEASAEIRVWSLARTGEVALLGGDASLLSEVEDRVWSYGFQVELIQKAG